MILFLFVAQPPSDTCPGNSVSLSSCSLSSPTSIYDFDFTSCNIATVSSISATNGSAGDSITITGKIIKTQTKFII